MNSVIKIDNLKKAYRLARPRNGQRFFEAVKGISFAVEKGEIFGILGPNGAGKTTTLEIIEGIKQQTEGTVNVLGLDNLRQAAEVRRRIGVQLQASDYLPYLTLAELLTLFASLYGKSADCDRLLELVDLTDKKNERVDKLSGGQKQRFTIASSLVNEPEIIFLDEPTTGLDPAARRQMWKLIKEINSRGTTVVLTTHFMEEAEFLCHRVAILDQGKILEIDQPKALIERLTECTQVTFLSGERVEPAWFTEVADVKKIYPDPPRITIELKSLDHISRIVQILKDHHINFSGFTVRTASLEDVYLQLTGHEYED